MPDESSKGGSRVLSAAEGNEMQERRMWVICWSGEKQLAIGDTILFLCKQDSSIPIRVTYQNPTGQLKKMLF